MKRPTCSSTQADKLSRQLLCPSHARGRGRRRGGHGVARRRRQHATPLQPSTRQREQCLRAIWASTFNFVVKCGSCRLRWPRSSIASLTLHRCPSARGLPHPHWRQPQRWTAPKGLPCAGPSWFAQEKCALRLPHRGFQRRLFQWTIPPLQAGRRSLPLTFPPRRLRRPPVAAIFFVTRRRVKAQLKSNLPFILLLEPLELVDLRPHELHTTCLPEALCCPWARQLQRARRSGRRRSCWLAVGQPFCCERKVG